MRVVNILLFIVILLVGLFSLNQDAIKEVQPAMFLPADTLIYIEQKNGAESLAGFHNSRLGRIVSSINFTKVLGDAGVESDDIKLVEKVINAAAVLRNDDLFQAILGKRLTLALIGSRDWSPNAASITDYLKSHMLLISRQEERLATIERLLTRYVDVKNITSVPYGRYAIKRIPISSDSSIAATIVDGRLLMSFEERVLRESLDLYDKKKNTLKANPAFVNISREMEGAGQFLYCSVKGLQKVASFLSTTVTDEKELFALHEVSLLKGVNRFSYGRTHLNKILKNRIIIGLEPETMDKQIRKMVATTPSINDSLPYAAKDVLLYYWSNSLELQAIWEMFRERVGADSDEVKRLQYDIHGLFSYDVNELIEMIGSDVGVIVRENSDELFVPIPDLALLVKLDDTARGADAIKNAVKHLDIELKKGRYKNIEYFSWGLDPKESLQPVYTIHRKYLIIANTLNMLKAIIDTPLNNTRLVAAKGFRELDPGFQTLNNSVCYIDQARSLHRLQEFVGWAGTMLAIQDRDAAEKSKTLIDNLIDPLFWGLGMYEKSAIRTYVRDERIYIESHTKLSN